MNRPPLFSAGRRPLKRGFSLVELLVVLFIFGLLMTLVVSPIKSSLLSYQLTGAGNQVAGFLERARIHATTTQRATAVRFYADPENKDTQAGYRIIQVVETKGGKTSAVSRVFRINDAVVLSGSRSPALRGGGIVSGTGSIIGQSNVPYTEFYFFPDGSTSLQAASPNPYLTLMGRHDEQSLKNPFVVSLDPVTARVTIFRR